MTDSATALINDARVVFGRLVDAAKAGDGPIDLSPVTMSKNALEIAEKRYLLKDHATGKAIETPVEMFIRVAFKLASISFLYPFPSGKSAEAIALMVFETFKDYYATLRDFRVIPGGRTLANKGTSVPNCIVLHINDSMKDIFATLADAALLQQSGSGLGFPLHLMRPTGARTVASGGEASGPISFLHVFNTAFGVVKQQNRHGANMAVMNVTHPDILEFIHCKEKEGDIRNFNISVGLTSEFMDQVRSNSKEPWIPTFGGKQWPLRRITRPQGRYTAYEIKEVTMTASELFHEIITAAWRNGEPGCVFPDRVNETNPLPSLGRIESCNPCGEQFLHDGDVCNLGHINLAKFVDPVTKQLDREALSKTAETGIRMLEDVVDTFDLPVRRVEEMAKKTRRCGLGLMGVADYFVMRGIQYDSKEALDEIDSFMTVINEAAVAATRQLAHERGVFPHWEGSTYSKIGDKRRNAFLTSIAPTGTTSMFADANSGIEPFFMLCFVKTNILGGRTLKYTCHPLLMEMLEKHGLATDEILDEISRTGSVQHMKDKLPEEIVRLFRTSGDISAEWHVKIQVAFQRHVDNAISKTCNFPESATVADVFKAYITAYEGGCKGLTVYRNNSRQEQVLESVADHERKQREKEEAKKALAVSLDSGEKALRKYRPAVSDSKGDCPDCNSAEHVKNVEGCMSCIKCGWSKCS